MRKHEGKAASLCSWVIRGLCVKDSRGYNFASVAVTLDVDEHGNDLKGKDRCDYRSNEE